MTNDPSRFELKIQTTGAAFRDPSDDATEADHQYAEMAAVATRLRNAARQIEQGSRERIILDSNGNTVGSWEFTR